jgi:Ser/Thr protein kinase RdoA (MazF antagonist)
MSTSAEPLPETPKALTPAWLSGVLNTEIAAVSWEVLGEGRGFMGDILRLTLHGRDREDPTSVIAKLPKRANRAMGELIGVYEREIMFFVTFAADVPVRIPRLLYADFDRDRGSENQEQILRLLDRLPPFLMNAIAAMGARVAAAKNRRYVLLLEDLTPMRPGDQLAGLDPEGCRQVLGTIARLHRHFWQSERLKGHYWLLPLDVDARLRHGRFRQNRERFAGTLGEGLGSTLAWLDRHGETLVRRFAAEAPETLAHCDLRLDNVLFDGSDCAVIDWQLVRRGPGALDVAYFLSGALSESCDATTERDLLQHYHEALDVPGYPFDAFERDYRRAMLMHLALLSSADEVDFGNDRGGAMMRAWLRRLTARVRSIEPAGVMSG